MIMTDQDIEIMPSDELVEDEPVGAEDEAVHAEEFEADQLDEAEAEELELAAEDELEADAGRAAVSLEELEAEEEEEEQEQEERDREHEADLEEILRGHYGLGEEEPEPDEDAEEAVSRPRGLAGTAQQVHRGRSKEFQCSVCFMLKPSSQLVDPVRGICVDCANNSSR
jgi:hypothetical protein